MNIKILFQNILRYKNIKHIIKIIILNYDFKIIIYLYFGLIFLKFLQINIMTYYENIYCINNKYLKNIDESVAKVIIKNDVFNSNLCTFAEIIDYDKFVENLTDEFEIKYKYCSYNGYDMIYKNNNIQFIKYNHGKRMVYIGKSVNLIKAIDEKFKISSISFKNNKDKLYKIKTTIPVIPYKFKNAETIYSDCDYIYDYKIYNSYPNLKYLIFSNATEIRLPNIYILNSLNINNIKFIYTPNAKIIKIDNKFDIEYLNNTNICLYAPNYTQIQMKNNILDIHPNFNILIYKYVDILM